VGTLWVSICAKEGGETTKMTVGWETTVGGE